MKPIAFLLVGFLSFCILWSADTPAQEPPNIKNERPVGKKPHYLEANSSSSGYQHQSYSLGTRCGIYLCDKWKPGIIKLNDGTMIDDRMIRYNIYNQQMEYAVDGDTAAIGNPEDIESLIVDGQTFVYRKFVCQQEVHYGYLELLVEGDYELLLFRGIRYEYVENPFDSDEGGPVTTYYADKRYFLSCLGKTAENLPDKKKDILNLMGDDKAEMKAYIKKHKCKLKEEQELIQFFSYANKP